MNKLILTLLVLLVAGAAVPSLARAGELTGVQVQGGAVVQPRLLDPHIDGRLDARISDDRRWRDDDDRRRPSDRRDDRRESSAHWQRERWRDSQDDRRHERHVDRRYWAYHRYRSPYRYHPPHGFRVFTWTIGHRLPPPFFVPQYRIDYRYYGLPRPPRGHYWVRVDDDVYLVNRRSGLVIDVRFGLFY